MFSYFDISFDLHLCKLHIIIAPFFVRYGLFQASMAECFFFVPLRLSCWKLRLVILSFSMLAFLFLIEFLCHIPSIFIVLVLRVFSP